MLQPEKYYTIKEVAQALNLTPGRIHHFISEGRIKSIKIGPIRFITEEEFKKLKAMERHPGRPKKAF